MSAKIVRDFKRTVSFQRQYLEQEEVEYGLVHGTQGMKFLFAPLADQVKDFPETKFHSIFGVVIQS